MKQAGSCNNCAKGVRVKINRDIFCRIHGIVSGDFCCARYSRRLEAWLPTERKPKCIECEFFIQDSSENGQDSANGYCQLFTVRRFDGEIKSACSKFLRKSERNIS